MDNNSGIYVIENIKNGKVYVGSSANLKRRKSENYSMLKYDAHPNRALQDAFNEYGEENLVFRVVEYVEVSELKIREQATIDSYDALSTYNIICAVYDGVIDTKTVKISAKAHHRLKVLAAQEGVSMMALMDSMVQERDFRLNGHYTFEATQEEVEQFLASYEQRDNWPLQTVRISTERVIP